MATRITAEHLDSGRQGPGCCPWAEGLYPGRRRGRGRRRRTRGGRDGCRRRRGHRDGRGRGGSRRHGRFRRYGRRTSPCRWGSCRRAPGSEKRDSQGGNACRRQRHPAGHGGPPAAPGAQLIIVHGQSFIRFVCDCGRRRPAGGCDGSAAASPCQRSERPWNPCRSAPSAGTADMASPAGDQPVGAVWSFENDQSPG